MEAATKVGDMSKKLGERKTKEKNKTNEEKEGKGRAVTTLIKLIEILLDDDEGRGFFIRVQTKRLLQLVIKIL